MSAHGEIIQLMKRQSADCTSLCFRARRTTIRHQAPSEGPPIFVDSAQSPADAADGTEVADLMRLKMDKALEDGVENNQKMAVTGFQFLVRVVQATSV